MNICWPKHKDFTSKMYLCKHCRLHDFSKLNKIPTFIAFDELYNK